MDESGSLESLTEASRMRKRQRGDGTNSDMPLHPDLQQQQQQQPAPSGTGTPENPQHADYQFVVRAPRVEHDYPQEMRPQHQADNTDYPRRRAMIACEVCRGRKTRCDGAKPKCRLCTDLGAECVYREPGQKLDAGDKIILEHLQRIEGLLQANYQDSHINHHNHRSYAADIPARSPVDASMSTPGRRIASLPLSDAATPQDGGASFTQLTSAPLMRQLIANSLPNTAYLQAESSRSEAVHSELNPELGDITSHVDAYFQFLHPFHAIINPETWQAVYATASLDGFSRGLETSTVLLVAALGWAAGQGDKLHTIRPEDTFGFRLFTKAWSSLPEMTATNGALSTQCLFLGAAFLLTVCKPLDSWYALVLATSKVHTELLLQTEPRAELESIKRLYWNIEQSKVDIASALELPNPNFTNGVGLPENYDSGLSYLLPQIGLQRLSQRLKSSALSANADSSTLLAQDLNRQLDLWYGHLPDVARFQQNAPVSDPVQMELRRGFFACRAQILRPIILQAMQEPSLLLDPVTREYCKQCLEAAIRQLENTTALSTGYSRCAWKHAHDMAAETLFVMGATLAPGLAALLPPSEDMDRIIAHVIDALERVASTSPSLGVKVNLLRSAEAERRQLQSR